MTIESITAFVELHRLIKHFENRKRIMQEALEKQNDNNTDYVSMDYTRGCRDELVSTIKHLTAYMSELKE